MSWYWQDLLTAPSYEVLQPARQTAVYSLVTGIINHTSLSLSRGCLQLLEILEISWNLIGPPGNFCVRCQRSTALVSSHKIVDKYSLQKYKIYRHQIAFSSSRCTKLVFGRGSAPDPCGELMTLPQIPIQMGRAEIAILWVFQLSEGGWSKANMSWIFLKIPPGISWKSPGNLLD